MFRQLDAEKITDTAFALARRVGERFPASGLSGVASDLTAVAKEAASRAADLSRPNWPLRIAAMFVSAAMFGLIGMILHGIRVDMKVSSAAELAQGFEALVNNLVFAGVAIWFMFSIETRGKRRKALALISQLRSLAHVIDMHQLTKDPERINDPLPATKSSPARMQMDGPLLGRYLDYCAEMLSILSKLAALQVQRFDDPITLEAVTDLEDLTSGLSRKIWQKIMILGQHARH